MIKKIAIDKLQPGMYVHDLNSSWVHHPFLMNRFSITTLKQVEDVVESGVKEVYIDTEKGHDTDDSVPEYVVKKELGQELKRVLKKKKEVKQAHVTASEEMLHAQHALSHARKTVRNILIDARMGKQVDIEKANHAVSVLADSVLRNKDALLSLNLIRHRDLYTFEHSVSVAVLLIAFAKELGLDSDETHMLGIGGLLHDVGKTKIPDEILNKPGKLSEKEFEVMKKHVEIGGCILSGYSGVDERSITVTCQHHERIDGSGYPEKLHGDKITLHGQMAAIADVYDAIVSDRCYHKGEPPAAVLKKLLEWSKHHFNEELVHIFIHCVGIYPVGTLVRLGSGYIAVVIEQGGRDLLKPVLNVIIDSKKKCRIKPFLYDLSNPPSDSNDKIVAYENPQSWGIQSFQYISH